MRYLTVGAVKAIHEEVREVHGGTPGLRDVALLESAVAAPQTSFGGELLLNDSIEIAAAYLFYLCRNHPFVDGNKRTAFGACLVFLDVNTLLPSPDLPSKDIDAWESFVLEVAESKLDRGQTTTRLRRLIRRRRT